MTTEAEARFQPEEFYEFVLSPERRVDPYPFYARLRDADPVHQIAPGLWCASGYEYVGEILRDLRFSSDERNRGFDDSSVFGDTPFGRIAYAMMVFRDEPDHKRLRDLVQKAFTRRVIEDLRPRIAALVDELLDPLIANGSGDLMAEFAYPMPVIVICELLGVPADDRHLFLEWSGDFAARFEIQPLRTPETEQRGDVATAKLTEYLEGLIAEKRKNPGNDLLTALASVEDDGDRLTHVELLATSLLILFAGHETTANLIGNGVHALLRNRDQWERLVRQPELVRSAVEEILRFDPPAQMLQRIALAEVEIAGQTIPKGETVAIMLAAANRDSKHFTDPDRLDITRDGEPLISFGAGVHFCLGAPLARLETQLALGALARRAPQLDFGDEEPQWRPSLVLRGLSSFPVRTN